jgi:hypothetical protein
MRWRPSVFLDCCRPMPLWTLVLSLRPAVLHLQGEIEEVVSERGPSTNQSGSVENQYEEREIEARAPSLTSAPMLGPRQVTLSPEGSSHRITPQRPPISKCCPRIGDSAVSLRAVDGPFVWGGSREGRFSLRLRLRRTQQILSLTNPQPFSTVAATSAAYLLIRKESLRCAEPRSRS